MNLLVALAATALALLVVRALRGPAPDPWDATRAYAHRREQLARACTRVSAGKVKELS